MYSKAVGQFDLKAYLHDTRRGKKTRKGYQVRAALRIKRRTDGVDGMR